MMTGNEPVAPGRCISVARRMPSRIGTIWVTGGIALLHGWRGLASTPACMRQPFERALAATVPPSFSATVTCSGGIAGLTQQPTTMRFLQVYARVLGLLR